MGRIVLFLWKIIYLIGSDVIYDLRSTTREKICKANLFSLIPSLQVLDLKFINFSLVMFKKDKFEKKNKVICSGSGGYSLIELLVAISVFVVVLSVNSNIFLNAVRGQGKAITTQNVSDNARYAMEVMARELRVARVTSLPADGVVNDITFISGSQNRLNKSIRFFLSGGSVMFDDDTTDANPAKSITSTQNVNVTGLTFTINNQAVQPRVTVVLKIESKGSQVSTYNNIVLQTTISPRELNL